MTMPRSEIRIADGDENRIIDVTLFPNQAYVTRQATTAVEAGVQRLQVEIHAFRIDPDSVQAKIFGRGELLGVQYKQLPVVDAPQQDLRELDDQLRRMRRERRRINESRQVVEKQQQFLDSTLSYAEVEVPREIKTAFPTAGQMGEMIDFMDQRYGRLSERHEKLTVEMEDIDNEILALERRLKKSKRQGHNTRDVIEVLFDSAEQQSLRLEVSYGAFQAGWTPFYKIDVNEDLGGLRLTQFARIRQTSGEAWNKVQLSVSTAELLQGAELPQAMCWILRKPEPVFFAAKTRVGGAPMPMPMAAAVEEAEAGVMDDSLEEPFPAEIAQAERKVLPSAFEYRLPLPVDVPSAEDDTLLTLTSRDAEGEFYHHAVPKIDPSCYLVCETAGDPELPPGQLNIHFGGRYVASTRLNEQNAGEPLRLNLGIDRSVRVKRETLTDKTAETFFRMVDRSHAARELRYRLKVENLREEPVKVSLFDSVPISESDLYAVKGIELEPEPGERDWQEREGVMRWRLEIQPKAKKEIQIRFFVKYPRGERPEGI